MIIMMTITINNNSNNSNKDSLGDSSRSLTFQLWSWHRSTALRPRKSAWSSPRADRSFSVPSWHIGQKSPLLGRSNMSTPTVDSNLRLLMLRVEDSKQSSALFSLYLKNVVSGVLGCKDRKRGRKGFTVHLVHPHPGQE